MKTNIIASLFFVATFVSCMQPVPRRPVSTSNSSFLENSVSFNKSLNEKEEEIFKELMLHDSITNYISSPNGFWYTYNVKSENSFNPQFGDQLVYKYEIFDLNGGIIYSADEIGEQTYFVDQQNIVEGLRNGLKIMNEGDVITFLFPSHKVFGYLGDENKIGTNQSLIYKVQLIKINKKNESN